MEIRKATQAELARLNELDEHIVEEELQKSIADGRVAVAMENGVVCGWLRYNLFWDNTPFLNMLCVQEEYQRRGLGSALVLFWEQEMKRRGYALVMTSTMSDEQAQHLYRKLGYKDAGCLLLEGEALEIIFTKKIA